MRAEPLDTLESSHRLEAAGFSREQAEAVVGVLSGVAGRASRPSRTSASWTTSWSC
jgi:hypothetical protein